MHRTGRTLLATLTLISATLIVGCSGSAQSPLAPTTVQNVSGAELQTLVDTRDRLVILDVRSVTEYDEGHIPDSVNIPLNELPARMDELNPSAPTVCVCASGHRSSQAAAILAAGGFSTVFNLDGGLAEWDGALDTSCPVCG